MWFVYVHVLVQLAWLWPVLEVETSSQTINDNKICTACERKQRYTLCSVSSGNPKGSKSEFLHQLNSNIWRKILRCEVLCPLRCLKGKYAWVRHWLSQMENVHNELTVATNEIQNSQLSVTSLTPPVTVLMTIQHLYSNSIGVHN